MLIPNAESKKIGDKIFEMIKQQFEEIGWFNLILIFSMK
jgi:hypothetical protein